jgi:hypothetical protein
VIHPILEFITRANHASMKVGTSVITLAIIEPGAARDISLSQNSLFLSRNIGGQN